MNFDERVVVNSNDLEWVSSPMSGVWRKPLAREAAESGHTTSVVRFDAGSYFSPHTHPVGEEILVLDGIFSDEQGDFPEGSYLRNPPGSKHKPFSEEGCTILVLLDQFSEGDTKQIHLNTKNTEWLPGHGNLQVMPLHEYQHEHIALVKWPAGEVFQAHKHFGGEEIFVLSGELKDEHGSYPAGSWLRSPHMSEHTPYVEEDTLIWVKTGHLPIPNAS